MTSTLTAAVPVDNGEIVRVRDLEHGDQFAFWAGDLTSFVFRGSRAGGSHGKLNRTEVFADLVGVDGAGRVVLNLSTYMHVYRVL